MGSGLFGLEQDSETEFSLAAVLEKCLLLCLGPFASPLGCVLVQDSCALLHSAPLCASTWDRVQTAP